MRALATLLLPALLVAAPSAPRPGWDGEFTLDSDRSDRLPEAIQKLTEPMNFMLRTFWKKKLEGSEKPAPTLSILKGTNLTMTLGKELPFTASAGSPASWTRADGEKFQVSFAEEGGAFTLAFQQDDVIREQRHSLSEDGKTLTVDVTYRHPKLPEALKYRLVYRRAGT